MIDKWITKRYVLNKSSISEKTKSLESNLIMDDKENLVNMKRIIKTIDTSRVVKGYKKE